MNIQFLGLLAETSIHPGAEGAPGFVDLPVAREAATDYPVVPGSSLKGALLGFARESQPAKAGATEENSPSQEGQRPQEANPRMSQADCDRIFGKTDNAGALLVSDARLLLLPVRSLQSAYKWVTCPHLLERFARDRQRAGLGNGDFLPASGQPSEGKYLGAQNGTLFLEERQFEHQGKLPEGLIAGLNPLVLHGTTRGRLAGQMVVLHDDDFAWFARYGLSIQARNVLDPDKKTSQNLWYEETIPADALFYAVLAERGPNAIERVKQLFKDRPYLRIGGNETVGMGWFAVTFPEGKGGAE
jgi:CRISPR-associated protein Cmr4